MPKNILVFSDGTGQAGGLRPDQRLSNVYKLFRATRVDPGNAIDPRHQVAFYDPGLGSEEVGQDILLARIYRRARKLISAMSGTGIDRNIADCYAAIIKHYEPGDRIYLFGFSRGAYTVRCLANVIALCGIPTGELNGSGVTRYGSRLRNIADEGVEIYEHGLGMGNRYKAERVEKARRFRVKYKAGSETESNAVPYFIGAFDTVASLGLPVPLRILGIVILPCAAASIAAWQAVSGTLGLLYYFSLWTLVAFGLAGTNYLISRYRAICNFPKKGDFSWHIAQWTSRDYDLTLDQRTEFARHALAIDENRKQFSRLGWGHRGYTRDRADGLIWFQQLWFPGCHSDVGGSYPEDESRLSDVSLQWMLQEATTIPHPIIVDRSKLNVFPDALGMQHCEIRALREAYPSWLPSWLRFSWPEKSRRAVLGGTLHSSVLERFDQPTVSHAGDAMPYRPEALRKDPRFSHHIWPEAPDREADRNLFGRAP